MVAKKLAEEKATTELAVEVPVKVVLQPIKGNYCPNCDRKLQTGLNREPICPIVLEGCPRNV